jgi:hypothetical protein
MKESLRRVILFAVIVITGSVMIFFDVPLILMIPLVLGVGFVILLLLGAITVADIKGAFTRKKTKNVKKISLIQRLNDMKFFEKKPVQQGIPQAVPDKKNLQPKSEAKRSVSSASSASVEKTTNTAKKPRAISHLRSFFTSLGSLRSILKERSKQAKKVEQINELLDKAVSEKVKSSALTSAGKGVDTKIPSPGSTAGPGTTDREKEQDPFLSLSGDEFDTSLLDGINEPESFGPASSEQIPDSGTATTGSDLTMSEPEIPLPSLDIDSEADSILKNNEMGLEEFSSLDGAESIDQDFSDLDNVNLDDIDLDVDLEEETPPAATVSPLAAENKKSEVNPDWIASDAPKGADLPGNQASTDKDMTAFAGGAAGSDADMLSSLASDVKYVAKEQNLSLLRDLKDFKAPASEIESELQYVHDRLKAGQASGKITTPPQKKTK